MIFPKKRQKLLMKWCPSLPFSPMNENCPWVVNGKAMKYSTHS
ncbi:hypothetical protein HMPREF3039_02295 [Akkermansia sp. KLE1798]|nr:hypothetical protein HMPREF3039_02295 [Akkermansia sp. KLE1798]